MQPQQQQQATTSISAKATALSLVEDHLTGLIQEALSVQRHAKRARLHEPAAAAALAQQQQDVVPVAVRRRVHAADITQALQLRGCETLYATPVVGGSSNSLVGGSDGMHTNSSIKQGGNNKKGTETASSKKNKQQVVQLKDFLQRECYSMSHSMAPTEVGARMHWLAVDGKQPEIPQNPAANIIPTAIGGVGAATGGPMMSGTRGSRGFVISDNDASVTTAAAAAAAGAGLEVFQLQSAVLSEELQLYFTRVALAMERGSATPENEHQQNVVLQSLACDAGLQELVPFLVRYCQQQLYKHSRRGRQSRGRYNKGGPPLMMSASASSSAAGAGAEHCRTLVRLATSMLRNPHLHLELQLHELLPALMTCVVTDSGTGTGRVGGSGSKRKNLAASAVAGTTNKSPTIIGQNNTSHWALRREASLALLTAWQIYGEKYVTLKADALKALCQAIGPDRPLATRYGGFVAISNFGPKAIDAFLLPSILACWKEWEEQLEQQSSAASTTNGDATSRTTTTLTTLQVEGIRMCQQAALDALNIFLNRVTDEEKAARLSWSELEEPLGDRLVALNGSRGSPYATCFV